MSWAPQEQWPTVVTLLFVCDFMTVTLNVTMWPNLSMCHQIVNYVFATSHFMSYEVVWLRTYENDIRESAYVCFTDVSYWIRCNRPELIHDNIYIYIYMCIFTNGHLKIPNVIPCLLSYIISYIMKEMIECVALNQL